MMDTHGLALDNLRTSCGLPLSAEQRQLVASGVKLLRLTAPTCRACLAAENRNGATPWYAKSLPGYGAGHPRSALPGNIAGALPPNSRGES
jgi:hypothetical protein